MNPNFEPKPRWPGAPPFCIAAQKLAFDDVPAARKFIEHDCPGVSLTDHYECVKCGKVHYEGYMRAPSGWSSGTGRRL